MILFSLILFATVLAILSAAAVRDLSHISEILEIVDDTDPTPSPTASLRP